MRSFDDGSSVSIPNAFNASFLSRLGERDEPPTAAEADTVGPWRIEKVPGEGFGLFRVGESAARGFEPVVTFPSRWLALLSAAILPATGRDPMLRLRFDRAPDGRHDVVLDDGELVGRFQNFDEKLLDGLNLAIALVRSPDSLTHLLEGAGAVSLERAGAMLDERVSEVTE